MRKLPTGGFMVDCVVCGDVLRHDSQYERSERAKAVIEAAKALLVDDCPLQQRVDRVVDTTQALLAAEKEKP
jgi:hypothetical protein